MGDYFFMFLIISNTTISVSNSIIYSISTGHFDKASINDALLLVPDDAGTNEVCHRKQHLLVKVSEQSPPFLDYDIIYQKIY